MENKDDSIMNYINKNGYFMEFSLKDLIKEKVVKDIGITKEIIPIMENYFDTYQNLTIKIKEGDLLISVKDPHKNIKVFAGVIKGIEEFENHIIEKSIVEKLCSFQVPHPADPTKRLEIPFEELPRLIPKNIIHPIEFNGIYILLVALVSLAYLSGYNNELL